MAGKGNSGQIDKMFRQDDDLESLGQCLKQLAVAEPGRMALRLALAQLLTEQESLEPALQAWQEILSLTPGELAPRLAYLDAMARLARPEEAIAQIETLLASKPDDTVLLGKLAELLHAQGDIEKAKTALAKLSAAEDPTEAAMLRMASLHERYGLAKEGIELLRAALAKDSKSEALQDALAAALFKSGQKEEATTLWNHLAEAADSWQRVTAVARQAAIHGEHEFAYTLLKERASRWAKEPLFLAEFIQLGSLNHTAEVLPWARQRVGLVASAMDADRAIEETVRLVQSAKEDGVKFRNGLLETAVTSRDHALLAALMEAAGDAPQADSQLEKAKAGDPLLGNLVAVRLLAQRNQPKEAAAALLKIFESADGKKTAHAQRLADLFRQAGQVNEALKWIAEWKRMAPGASQPYVIETEILVQEGRANEAMIALKQATQKFPAEADLKAKLASLREEAGQQADARRLYEQLYEDATDSVQKLRWVRALAEAARNQGAIDELVEQFNERRRSNRTSILPLLALAEIHRVNDNHEKRRDALLEAARIKPADVDLLLEIARVEGEQFNIENALTTLRKARPLDKSGRADQMIIQMLLASGRTEEAMKEIETQTKSGIADARAIEAMAQGMRGDDEMITQFLQSQCARFPDDYRLRYLLAQKLARSGQHTAAFEQVLQAFDCKIEIVLPNTGITSALPGSGMLNANNPDSAKHSPPGTSEAFQILAGLYTVGVQGPPASKILRGFFSPSLRLPDSLSDKDSLCLAWICRRADEHPEEKPALLAHLAARQIPEPEVLMDLCQAMCAQFIEDKMISSVESLKKHPSNDLMLSVYTLLMASKTNAPNVEVARMAHEKLQEKYPILGFLAALQCFSEPDASLAPLRKEVLELPREKFHELCLGVDPNELHLSIFGRAELDAVREMASREDPAFVPDIKALRSLLTGLFKQLPLTGSHRLSLLKNTISWCREGENYSLMMDLVLTELLPAITTTSSAGRSPSYRGYLDFRIPNFPPDNLKSVPSELVELMTQLKADFETLDDKSEQAKSKAAWLAMVDSKISDPVLKTVFASPANDAVFLAKCLADLAKLSPQTQDSETLLGSWEAAQEHWLASAGWFQKMLLLPLTKDERIQIDSWLTSLVLEHKDDFGQEPSPLLAAAKDSALRLRLVATRDEDLHRLATALKSLGAKELADSLRPKGKGSGAAGGSGSRRLSTGPSSRQPIAPPTSLHGRAKLLVDQGRKEEAVSMLVKRALPVLAENRSPRVYLSQGVEQLEQDFKEAVEMIGSDEDFFKAIHPETGSNRVSWEDFIDLMMLVEPGEKERAVMFMREALVKEPGAGRIRFRLALALLEKFPEEADKVMSESPPAALNDLIPVLDETWFWYSESSSIRTFKFCQRVVDRFKNAPDARWFWVISVMKRLRSCAEYQMSNDLDLEAYLTQRFDDPDLSERTTGMLWAYEEFIHAASEIPVLRAVVFDDWAAFELRRHHAGEPLRNTAMDLVLHPPIAPFINPGNPDLAACVIREGAENAGMNRMTRCSPLTVLLEDATKRGTLPELKARLLSEFVKSNRKSDANLFKEIIALWECHENQFLAAAQTFRNGARNQSNYESLDPRDASILNVWASRKLHADLGPMILAKLTPAVMSEHEMPELIEEWLRALAVVGDRSLAKKFLLQLVNQLLGPFEKRAELMGKIRRADSEIDQCMVELSNLFKSLKEDGRLELLASEVLSEQLSPFHSRFSSLAVGGEPREQPWNGLSAFRAHPEKLRDELALSFFVLDLPECAPMASPENAAGRLAGILAHLADLPEVLRQDFTTIAPKGTFGGSLFHAAMTDGGISTVLELINLNRPRIEHLPIQSQFYLRRVAEILVGKTDGQKGLSVEARNTLKWLAQASADKLPPDPRLTLFLKTPVAPIPDFESNAFASQAADLAAAMSLTSMDAMVQTLRHARKVLAANASDDFDPDAPIMRMAAEVFDIIADGDADCWRAGMMPSLLRATMSGMLEDSTVPGFFTSDRWADNWLTVNNWDARLQNAPSPRAFERWKTMAGEADGVVPSHCWPALAGTVVSSLDAHYNYGSAQFHDCAQSLETSAATSESARSLMMILRLGESFYGNKTSPPVNALMALDNLPECQRWLLDALRDKAQSLNLRYATAMSTCHALAQTMDSVLLVEVMKILQEAMEQKLPWNLADLSCVFQILNDAPPQPELVQTTAAGLWKQSLACCDLIPTLLKQENGDIRIFPQAAAKRAAPESLLEMMHSAVQNWPSQNPIPMSWLAAALENGRIDAGRYLVSQARGSWSRSGVLLSKPLLNSLPALLELISSVDERWMLETRLMMSPESEDKAKAVRDKNRLEAFANRLREATGLSLAVQDQCVAMLCREHENFECRRILEAKVTACLARHPLNQLLQMERDKSVDLRSPADDLKALQAEAASDLLIHGLNCDAWLGQLEKIVSTMQSEKICKDWGFASMLDQCGEFALEEVSEGRPMELKKVAAGLRKVLFHGSIQEISSSSLGPVMVMIHGLADDMPALFAVVNSLSETDRNALAEIFDKSPDDSAFERWQKLLLKNEPVKAAAIQGLITGPWPVTQGSFNLNYLFDHHLTSREEMIRNADLLLANHPASDGLALGLFDCTDRTDQLELLLKCRQRHAELDDLRRTEIEMTGPQAMALQRLGRNEEAAQVLGRDLPILERQAAGHVPDESNLQATAVGSLLAAEGRRLQLQGDSKRAEAWLGMALKCFVEAKDENVEAKTEATKQWLMELRHLNPTSVSTTNSDSLLKGFDAKDAKRQIGRISLFIPD